MNKIDLVKDSLGRCGGNKKKALQRLYRVRSECLDDVFLMEDAPAYTKAIKRLAKLIPTKKDIEVAAAPAAVNYTAQVTKVTAALHTDKKLIVSVDNRVIYNNSNIVYSDNFITKTIKKLEAGSPLSEIEVSYIF